MIDKLGYLADAAVITTYLLLAFRNRALPFHYANALGAIPVVVGEIQVGAHVPLILTTFFGIIGWLGIANHYRKAKAC